MPIGDIMPFKSPLGGTFEVRHAGMTASQTFLMGQPVNIVDAGTVTAAPNDTTEWLLADADSGRAAGISAVTVGVDDGDGTTSATYVAGTSGNQLPINPATGAAYTTNDTVMFWPINQGTLFITDNFHDTATTAAVTPAVTDIGEAYLISCSQTAAAGYGWGLEQSAVTQEAGATAGLHVYGVVYDVLDANKAPIRLSGGTGVYLVFEIVAQR